MPHQQTETGQGGQGDYFRTLLFFNQETSGLDDQQLSVLFRELGFLDVGFAHVFVQAFLSGHFMYHEPG